MKLRICNIHDDIRRHSASTTATATLEIDYDHENDDFEVLKLHLFSLLLEQEKYPELMEDDFILVDFAGRKITTASDLVYLVVHNVDSMILKKAISFNSNEVASEAYTITLWMILRKELPLSKSGTSKVCTRSIFPDEKLIQPTYR